MIGTIFSETAKKKVSITEMAFGVPPKKPIEGVVTGYCYGQGSDMFLILDGKKLVNTKYIADVEILD